MLLWRQLTLTRAAKWREHCYSVELSNCWWSGQNFQSFQNMTTSPVASAVVNVPKEVLSLLLILPNSGKWRTLEYRHSHHGIVVNFNMTLTRGPQGDRACKSCLWGVGGGGYSTVDEVRLNNSILGLNSIDFPVQQASEDIPGPDVWIAQWVRI